MPIHLPPISRRRFLAGSVAAAAGMVVGGPLWAADRKTDANRLALFSDIHLSADKTKIQREVNMWEHLEKARAEALALETLPSMLLINGDLALDQGLAGDYATVLDAVKPFREAGLPIHLAMGNHDNRETFLKSIPDHPGSRDVQSRITSVVKTPLVNWVMLDSLEVTKQTPGLLGEEQLTWLEHLLDADEATNWVVMVHHNPQYGNPAAAPASKPAAGAAKAAGGAASGGSTGFSPAPGNAPAAKVIAKTSGLKDTKQLLKILVPRKQVKALLFGHTHKWVHTKEEDLHLVNLPAVAYPFAKNDPTGWVDCQQRKDGMKLQLHTSDPKHPQQGDVVDLKWR